MFIPSIIRRLSLCKKSISTLPFPPISKRKRERERERQIMLKLQGPGEDTEGRRLPQHSVPRSQSWEWTPGGGGEEGRYSKEGAGGWRRGDSFHCQNINHPQRESLAPQSHKQFPRGSRFQRKKGSSWIEWERESARERLGFGFGIWAWRRDGAVEERGRRNKSSLTRSIGRSFVLYWAMKKAR